MASKKKAAPESFFDANAGTAPPPPAPPPARKPAARKTSTTQLQGLRPMRVQPSQPAPTADAQMSPQIDRKALAADIERIRKTRKPFGSMTQKLAYPQIPGYHIHWFSDDPGRVEEAENNGWAHVLDKTGQPVKRVVGRGRDGRALDGFLMKLPQIFWDEDMAYRHDAAQARIDEIKKAPFRAKPGQAQRSDAGKFYSPKEEGVVQMTDTLSRSRPSV